MFSFCCHGGAGDIARDVEPAKFYEPLIDITKEVYRFANAHLSDDSIQAVDLAEFAVSLFENCETFNAGKGSVLTSKGTFELEASIMDGATLSNGAALLLKRAKNPISVARAVMEHGEHCTMVGDEAESLAITSRSVELVSQGYYFTQRRYDQLQMSKESGTVKKDHDLEKSEETADDIGKFGTVGCVCWYKGHVAAATSTGGMTNKLPGRVGDSAMIGCGTYANDQTCAVSCTGKGEVFIQHVVAHSVSSRISLGGASVQRAIKDVVHDTLPSDSGGVIAIDGEGIIAMEFNTTAMLRLSCDHNAQGRVGIWEEEVPMTAVN